MTSTSHPTPPARTPGPDAGAQLRSRYSAAGRFQARMRLRTEEVARAASERPSLVVAPATTTASSTATRH